MSLRTPRLLTADHNCQHPSGRCVDIAATYPANNNRNGSSEDNDGWNLPDFEQDNYDDEQDWTEVERCLVGSRTTLNVVGSCRQPPLRPANTTASIGNSAVCVATAAETATAPTTGSAVVANAANAKGCAFDLSGAQAHRQEERHGSHLLEGPPATRLLPVARVCPISIHSQQTAATNGCPISSRRSQNDLLFLSSGAIGSPNADPIAKLDTAYARRADELDRLAEKYLDEMDKLNLAYYLNEYETNGCDLSELLTNLIRDLLAKLPNPAIKYQLLSLIKRVYIDDECSANQLPEDEREEWKNPQLDVLLFDTMLHQYLMASSFNQISANDYLAERKRKRRQRRAAQLAAAAAAAAAATSRRHHQRKQLIDGSVVVRPNGRETSPLRRRRQLRNLGPERSGAAEHSLSGAVRLPASKPTTAEPTTTTAPSAAAARLDYCYGEQVERREFDQENESLHPLTQGLVISSTPSPSLSSLSSIQQQQQEAISTNASGVVCGQSARLAAVAISSMDYSQSAGCGNLSRWHELNLLSAPPLSSCPTSLLAQQRHRNNIDDVSQPPPSNETIYPPAGSLFAKQQQQQNYHLSDYHRQDQHPSSERQQFQADSALADCSSLAPLIPDASQQQSWTNSSGSGSGNNNNNNNNIDYPPASDDANQRQSHGINSMAFGDGSSSDWPLPPPVASAHLIPSGSRPFPYQDQQHRQPDQWRPNFNVRPELELELELEPEEDEEDAGFDYKPLVNNNSSPVTGSRSAAYQWPPTSLALNQRHLAGSRGSSTTTTTSELLLPPVVGGRDLVRQQQRQSCRCDQCRPFESLPLSSQPFIGPQTNQTNRSRPTATNWIATPYYQQSVQHHLGSQRSASVQNNHQLDPRQLEQRCFSSMSVHYDDQGQPVETQTRKMAMTPLQQQQQGFVNSPPADCCSVVGNSSRPQQAWPASQRQRFVQQQQQQATYSSLPSSPVALRHYLAQRPLPGGSGSGGRAATAAPGSDGLWPGRGQDYPQPQPQHRRQHHQSIQLKDWPHGNTQAPSANQQQQQLSADPRRSQQNLAFSFSPLSRHQPSASAATARSATIDSSSRLGHPGAPNEQKLQKQQQQQQQYKNGATEEELEEEEEEELEEEEEEDEFSGDECALVPLQAKGKLPLSVAEQMERQASNFVHQYGSAAAASASVRRRSRKSNLQAAGGSKKPNLLVRRTLRVKIKKSKPILGIAIEGGFNVSGQLLPRVVCVHEDGAAYQCGKLRASDLILEVNGNSTVNMTHDQIARTIATAYYQDPRPYIEFLIGESMHAA